MTERRGEARRGFFGMRGTLGSTRPITSMSRVKGSASRGETFLEMVKANFVAAREIMIEFVFSLCENGCVPGSVTAPHRTDSIIRLTRGRPGERFFVRALHGESSTGQA